MRKSFSQSDLLGETPAPIQLSLLAAKEFEIGMITGFASGKTRGVCAAALAHGIKYPGAKVLLGRKTYSEMVQTVKQPFFAMAEKLAQAGWFVKPVRWDYREGTHVARLTNGSQFFFSNLDDPIKFRNEEYSMVVVDQAEENSEEMWDLLTGRIRHAAVPAAGWQAIAAANDNGHNWVWRRFVHQPELHAADPLRCGRSPFCVFREGHPDEDGNPRNLPCSTRRFFHGTTLDNRHNLSARYLTTLLSHPKEWQRHFIFATMEGGSGRLLPDPTVVPHFEPPPHWPRYRAIDHALNSPCCCLWIAVNIDAVVVGGVVPSSPYVYREYWATHSSVDQHARRILDASNGERIEATVIDKSVFALTQSRQNGVRISIGDLYAEEGLFCSPSVGDPFARVERITICHNKGLVVSDRCTHLISSMPDYYAEQSRTDNSFKILNKSEFHAVDALGYGLMIIPLDPRDLVADARDLPPKEILAQTDPLSRLHHLREWRRMRAFEDKAQADNFGSGGNLLKNVSASEFWGETVEPTWAGDDVIPFDPYGRESVG